MIPKITEELEAYFTALTLKYEICPVAKYGIDRITLERVISEKILADPCLKTQPWFSKIFSASQELGTTINHFVLTLSSAYLTWLYSQQEQVPPDIEVTPPRHQMESIYVWTPNKRWGKF